jgi:tetratricopeptide (TPR) repeat protein
VSSAVKKALTRRSVKCWLRRMLWLERPGDHGASHDGIGHEATLFLLIPAILLLRLSRAGAAVSQDAGNTHSAVTRAQAALESGNSEAAIRVLLPWLHQHAGNASARVLLGRAYEAAGDYTRAQVQFQLALKSAPDNPEALTALGTFYDRSGHPAQAEPLLARAARFSTDPQARLAWAVVLTKLHRYREAAEALGGVHPPQAQQERIAYFRLRASVELGNGNAESAARDMRSALALSPQNLNLQAGTAIAEMKANEWNAASRILEPVFYSTQSPQIGLYLVEAEIRARRNHSAVLSELRAIRLPAKQEWLVRQKLGELLMRSGSDAEAVQDLEQAAKDAPGNAAVCDELAVAQFRAGQLGAALETAKRARSLQESATIESVIGDIQEREGASLDAVHSYQRAVALEPGSEQYWLTLAFELLRHETYKPALIVLERAAKKFPSSVRIQIGIGLTQYFLEDYRGSTQSLLSASLMNPGSRMAVDYLGQLQLQQPVTPDSEAVHTVCQYADAHTRRAEEMADCGALLARMERDRGDAQPSPGALRRLESAARIAPGNVTARCELGKSLEWVGQWRQARTQLEACARLKPDSAEAHYRLAQIYLHLGQAGLARKETLLHDRAVRHMVAANAQRDATVEKFLFTIEGSATTVH